MAQATRSWTLGELGGLLGAEVYGDASTVIRRAVPAGEADPEALTFADKDKFVALVASDPAGAVLVKNHQIDLAIPQLVAPEPRVAFARFLAMLERPLPLGSGIDSRAAVSPDAQVHPSASVGPFAVVEAGAKLDEGSKVYPFAYIGAGCSVGPQSVVRPHAVLVQDVEIGVGCLIHAGAVLGTEGFGFVWDGEKQQRIPQVGGTRLGDFVEVGANAAIDRAMCGTTSIREGVKLDNLVHIGHNCSVGEHTVMAALTGVSGSCTIGRRVVMGGGCGVADHVTIVDDVALGGRSGVLQNIDEPGVYLGIPVDKVNRTLRLWALLRKLPELLGKGRS